MMRFPTPLANKAPWNEKDYVCTTCDGTRLVDVMLRIAVPLPDRMGWTAVGRSEPCPDCGSAEEKR